MSFCNHGLQTALVVTQELGVRTHELNHLFHGWVHWFMVKLKACWLAPYHGGALWNRASLLFVLRLLFTAACGNCEVLLVLYFPSTSGGWLSYGRHFRSRGDGSVGNCTCCAYLKNRVQIPCTDLKSRVGYSHAFCLSIVRGGGRRVPGLPGYQLSPRFSENSRMKGRE